MLEQPVGFALILEGKAVSSSWFDTDAVLAEMGELIDILPEELAAVEKRLTALATRSVPPVWGYAGLLMELVVGGDIMYVSEVYSAIEEWIRHPGVAEKAFRDWNTERLAK